VFPLRSLRLAGPILLACALVGWIIGQRLQILLRVRVCYRCGRPVCRRCLVRARRRAYCATCGETMGGLTPAESTRSILHSLIQARSSWPRRAARIVAYLLPGFGAVARGHRIAGMMSTSFAGLALALLLFPFWGRPYFPLGHDPVTVGALRALGLLAGALSAAISALGIEAAEKERGTIRAFLNRDVDRLAA
jgi:hypothetical protein